jgi:hypothetical protein
MPRSAVRVSPETSGSATPLMVTWPVTLVQLIGSGVAAACVGSTTENCAGVMETRSTSICATFWLWEHVQTVLDARESM